MVKRADARAHLAVGLDVHVRARVEKFDALRHVSRRGSGLQGGEPGKRVVVVDPHLA